MEIILNSPDIDKSKPFIKPIIIKSEFQTIKEALILKGILKEEELK